MFRKVLPWSGRESNPGNGRDPVFVEGERVVLREKQVSDIADDYQWRTDPELAELDATRPLQMNFSDFERYSIEELNYPASRSKRLAVDTVCGSHIGNVMFYDIDLRTGEAELGIMIGDKDYWSQGYGTETVGLLLDHMFQEYPFNRVYLHTLSWNYRAQKSFHKSGFKDVKPVRRGGLDFIQMEIWRHEWDAIRAATASEHMGESSSCG